MRSGDDCRHQNSPRSVYSNLSYEEVGLDESLHACLHLNPGHVVVIISLHESFSSVTASWMTRLLSIITQKVQKEIFCNSTNCAICHRIKKNDKQVASIIIFCHQFSVNKIISKIYNGRIRFNHLFTSYRLIEGEGTHAYLGKRGGVMIFFI